MIFTKIIRGFISAMCEPATHRRWALSILTRAKLYGIIPNSKNSVQRFNTP
ncbi:TPA: HpcH/HpaI aldolase/citrate lyase family protein, partial [Proteus mirabilis]